MAIEVERVKPADDQLAEEWVRKSHQDDITGVGASRWRDGGDWRELLICFAALVVAGVAYLRFDPSAPDSIVSKREDPSPFDSERGREQVYENYRFQIEDPWRLLTEQGRERYRQRLAEMQEQFEGGAS